MKRWWLWIAAANGAYALWWLVRAGARVPFWYDELFTVRLSEIPTVGGLWHALSGGFDFNPPGLYLVTRLARLTPVTDPLASRLPALLGLVLLMTSLFVFLRRRVGAAFATAAVALLPLSNFVERYAIEARAYMLLLGVSGCALVCWQAIGQPSVRGRMAAACGLSLAVAAALTLHVWSVILPAGLLAGEVAIAIRARQVRWITVVALAASAPVIAMYPMLLGATGTVSFANVVYAPSGARLLSAMSTTLPRLRALALVGLTLIVVYLVRRWRTGSAQRPMASHGLAWEERVVFIALLLSPLVPYVYALSVDGAFMTRYALYAVIGVTGLLADILCAASQGSATTGVAVAIVASLSLWGYLPARAWVSPHEEIPSLRVLRSGPSLSDAPVVLVNPLDVLALDERATEPEQRALTFVADPAMARRYTGADLVDVAYLRGESYLHMRIARRTYAELTGNSHLYLLGEWQPLTWLPRRLADDGWTMTRIGGSEAAPLFDARRR